MNRIDSSISDSLASFTSQTDAEGRVRFQGTMQFPAVLEGPPARVHGGFHPLVRTLPVLARLRESLPPAVRIDASLQKALPLGEPVAFTGSYQARKDDFDLTTRFLDSDRLIATARKPTDSDLPSGSGLDRFRALYEQATQEEAQSIRVIGVRYRVSASAVVLDLREPDAVDETSPFRLCIGENGALGLAALSTQLDAVGATAQGVRMRHPHFTKQLSLSFDTHELEPGMPLLVFADRTTLHDDLESDTPKVDIRGSLYGTVRAEVIAVDARFERCFAHGFVWSHPVDPSRYAGFEGMRKLREIG